MKILKVSFCLILISVLLITCNNEDLITNESEDVITITSNLKNKTIGTFLIKSGVSDVDIKKKEYGILSFKFLTQKETGFRKVNYNLADYEFRIENNKLHLKDYSIKKTDNDYTIFKKNNIIDIKNNAEYLNDFDLIILGIVYDELSKNNLISYKEFMKTTDIAKEKPCAWWNTHTITGIGWTSGGASADLYNATIQDANNGNLKGCTSLGGVESNSRLGGLYFTASQSFCCP